MSTPRVIMLVVGLVLTAAGLAIGLPDLLSGDHDKYGRIDAPGKGRVELPEGEVVVFNEVARSFGEIRADGPRPVVTFGTSGVTTEALVAVIAGAGIGSTLIALAFVLPGLGRRPGESA